MFKNKKEIKKLQTENLELKDKLKIYTSALNFINDLSTKNKLGRDSDDIIHQISKISEIVKNKETNSTDQSKVSFKNKSI